ncbi:MAG: hydrogenase maturation protease [Burkholderiales bacterium]|nr:hydrogenase maturation protease [Burkholderiales bacterium]GIK86914.1 MAG: hypothetical protein BroJett026_23950 [Betaproteobacteria bacterium]
MIATRLLVLAWGNDARGDDALGPAFCERASYVSDPPGTSTTFVDDFQLQPEHAVDVAGHDLVLFVDASRDVAGAYAFGEVLPARTAAFSTHGVAPGVVLEAFRQTYSRPPPPAFLLGIRGESFALGEPLSLRARHNLDAAVGFFALLRRRPVAEAWRAVARDRDRDPATA